MNGEEKRALLRKKSRRRRAGKEKKKEKEMVKEHFRMDELDNEIRDWMTKYWLSSYWISWGTINLSRRRDCHKSQPAKDILITVV